MKNREEATEIARQHVARIAAQSGGDLVLVPEDTVEFDLGWIFFWDSKRFLETKDFSDAIAGNAPIIVTAETDRCTRLQRPSLPPNN